LEGSNWPEHISGFRPRGVDVRMFIGSRPQCNLGQVPNL